MTQNIDPTLPVKLSTGKKVKIVINHGDWFETDDGGCFDLRGKSMTGFTASLMNY